MEKVKKSLIPGYLGVAFVWFAVHVGPGTASGRQTTVYYVEFGKWALFTPFLAMAILGFCIYVAIEISRLAKATSFKDFADKLFHPYEKIFANIFEFIFVATVGMVGGACVYAGAYLFEIYLGLPVWFGMLAITVCTIVCSICGTELVRSSSSYMSILIFITMSILAILGLAAVGGPANALAKSSFSVSSPVMAGWSAIVYAAFQSVGVVGGVVAVSDALGDKKDSIKAAVSGVFMNAIFLIIIAVMLFGFPASINETLPNFYVATQLGYPFLVFVYATLLFLACVTTTITFSNALIRRYSKFLKIENFAVKSLIICVIALAYMSSVSFFGLAAIVRTGFTYLGYSCLVVVMLPLIVIGPMKIKKLRAEAGE